MTGVWVDKRLQEQEVLNLELARAAAAESEGEGEMEESDMERQAVTQMGTKDMGYKVATQIQ